MIEMPTFGGDVTILEAAMGFALFWTGYAVHEALHVLPLKLLGYEYEVNILPTKQGQSKLTALFSGTVVEITTEQKPARSHMVVSALAPSIMSVFPLLGLVFAFSYPVVDMGTFMVLFLWFAVSIPSLRDWAVALHYRPNYEVEA